MGTAVSVAAGTIAGLGGAWLGLLLMGRPPVVSKEVSSTERVTASARTHNATSTREEREVAQTQCAAASSAPAAVPGEAAQRVTGAPLARPTEEDISRRTEAEWDAHRGRVIAHEQEPRDPRWAREKEASLTTGFRELSQATSSTLQSLDCRSVSCVASFTWPDEGTARQQLYQLVSSIAPSAMGAVRYVNLEPGDGKGPAKASMILDWTEADDVASLTK